MPYTLSNFEIQMHYDNDFYLVHSINSLPKTNNRAYVINLDALKSIGTHCIASCENSINIIYFDSFGVENNANEIWKIKGNKNIITNI